MASRPIELDYLSLEISINDGNRIHGGHTKDGETYGPIFGLRVGFDTIVMLNNHSIAHDLLDKRSNIYSFRSRLVMGVEIVSNGLRTLLMPYGPQWRTHQSLQASYLNVRTSQSYTGL